MDENGVKPRGGHALYADDTDKIFCPETKIAGGTGIGYELRLEASQHLLISRKNTSLPPDRKKGILWQMKLRTDLVKHATPEEALKEALANNHRYKPEPLFSKTGDWQSVIRHNRGVCERGRAQHGTNSESFKAVSQEWEQKRRLESAWERRLDFLRACHRRAPFLFFNGNTFADIARTFSDYLFAELPHGRRREATSVVAHYVAGVLDRESMSANSGITLPDRHLPTRRPCDDPARFGAWRHQADSRRWPRGLAARGHPIRIDRFAGKFAAGEEITTALIFAVISAVDPIAATLRKAVPFAARARRPSAPGAAVRETCSPVPTAGRSSKSKSVDAL